MRSVVFSLALALSCCGSAQPALAQATFETPERLTKPSFTKLTEVCRTSAARGDKTDVWLYEKTVGLSAFQRGYILDMCMMYLQGFVEGVYITTEMLPKEKK